MAFTYLCGNDDNSSDDDNEKPHTVHPPHEPALGQAEEAVRGHRLVQEGGEPGHGWRRGRRGQLYLALNTSSLLNPRMMVTPAMEEEMW